MRRTAILPIVAALAVLAGCANTPAGGTAPPTTSVEQRYEDDYVAALHNTPGTTSTAPREQLIGAGNFVCTSIGNVGVSRESLVQSLTTSTWGPQAAPVIVDMSHRHLCPTKVFAAVSYPSAAQATPAPEPPPPVEKFTGTGADVIDLATPLDVGVFTFECPDCTGNTVVKTNAGIDELLVNTIGSYSGSHWLGFRGGVTSRIQVQADGDWTATVGGLDLATRAIGNQPVSGSGDEVLLLSVAPDTVRVTNNGESNFVVWLMTDSLPQPDLVINEIGDYEGTVLFDVNGREPAVVQVTSDGDWTMTPE